MVNSANEFNKFLVLYLTISLKKQMQKHKKDFGTVEQHADKNKQKKKICKLMS